MTNSKWASVVGTYFDIEDESVLIDAWVKTEEEDPNEEGVVIAKIHDGDEVIYFDEDARTDEYAQKIIKLVLEEGVQND